MNVNSVSTNNAISALDPLLTSQTQGQTDSSGAVGSSSSISSFASLMNTLQQLSQSNPSEFQQVMANVASTLQTDASSATGSQAQFLTQLSDRFQQASQTGSMSALQPPSGGHHHHHHHGVQSYSAQQSSTSGPTQQASGISDSAQQPLHLAQIIQSALQQAGVSVS